ncbi:hypothetical protein AU468_11795 [Alkalispirochaeta sphaeroplastigenens]|uniref:DUF503 domain-containing protein n=1 Tax=Alkalispirochaeta sphaeroplastigenens TaxID=1187066 RepID=A0A2S4JH30_9SPIO|nr:MULTISPECIES: DUF503 domain-containing protein [Alkalispirochaeta]POQ98720.1 hypothetical protein AU468_11795 [Alkalispirochaeta sphaeroplastigenens]
MTVTMLLAILELPGLSSLKDKRRIVHSLRDRLIRTYKVSVAEVDLQNSHSFSQIGVALVSNDKVYGERVMQKVLAFLENHLPGRVADVQIHSEIYETPPQENM